MPRLIYVADPMCSWCWGFAPVLEAVEARIGSADLVLGGLAPDDERPMDATTRNYVQRAWDAVEARTGARFERAFWERCEPRRSTWPACRAVVAARAQGSEPGWRLFRAIQRAYYLEARNPSDVEVLLDLASELGEGLDLTRFTADFQGEPAATGLARDRARAAELGVHGFPWLGLRGPGRVAVLAAGWRPAEAVLETLDGALAEVRAEENRESPPPSEAPEDWGP